MHYKHLGFELNHNKTILFSKFEIDGITYSNVYSIAGNEYTWETTYHNAKPVLNASSELEHLFCSDYSIVNAHVKTLGGVIV